MRVVAAGHALRLCGTEKLGCSGGTSGGTSATPGGATGTSGAGGTSAGGEVVFFCGDMA